MFKIKIIKIKIKDIISIFYFIYSTQLCTFINENWISWEYNPYTKLFYIDPKNKIKINQKNLFKFQKELFFLAQYKKFKIYYTGKGYRIRKQRSLNYLILTFGACHMTNVYIPQYKLKLKRKKAIIVYYNSYAWVNLNFQKLINIKILNLYTQRGLKSSKRVIYKKPKSKLSYI